ncbi:MAG: molecular chaperone HtpG [Opitutales bacterium]
MSTTAPETHEFQAEVKQVLDIVVHSLYTDKEIFIRELISNGSDALEKLRHLQLTEKNVFDDNLGLELSLTSDDTAGTLTIQDFGVGMNREELVENLGTIAHSGSKAFLKALQESGGDRNDNLIGQFGVGFYSVFMVADEVKVYTRSWKPDGEGLLWTSDGSGSYSIEPTEGLRRGTKIVVKLASEHKEFAREHRVKQIVEQYSRFVQFPIQLNGEKVNTMKALWLRAKNEIKAEEYTEFYKYQAHAAEDPFDWFHFSADAPLAINALVYIPGMNQERFGFGRTEPGVALYCRKVLIDPSPEKLLPEWCRFLKGVVDSADLPLNISRESMQDSALVQKLGRVITKRFIKHLDELAKKDAEKYVKFFKLFGHFLKEGVVNDFNNKDALAPLLRFESSATEAGAFTSLQAYVDRMKPDQKTIYTLSGPSRQALESGPYLEAFQARGLEVLFFYEPVDEFTVQHLGTFAEKTFASADQADIDLGKSDSEPEGEPLEREQVEALCGWLKETLGEEKVSRVAPSERLVGSPAVALNADKMMSTSMRRLMQAMKGDQDEPLPPPAVNLEINPRHPLVRNLSILRETDSALAELVAQQVLDNALTAAGLLEDPRAMVGRVYELLERVSRKD